MELKLNKKSTLWKEKIQETLILSCLCLIAILSILTTFIEKKIFLKTGYL